MKPHKHCEVIKAWADGARIEYRKFSHETWKILSHPVWNEDNEYRVAERRMYRLGFYIGATRNYVVAHQADSLKELRHIEVVESASKDFIRWLSDWTELPND